MNVLDAWLYSVSPNIGIEEEAISITESEYNIYTKSKHISRTHKSKHTACTGKVHTGIYMALQASTIVNMYGTLLLRSRNMWKPGNNHRGSSDVTCASQNESNGDVLLCYILRFSASTETWDILLL